MIYERVFLLFGYVCGWFGLQHIIKVVNYVFEISLMWFMKVMKYF
jgi:hypothetical protein